MNSIFRNILVWVVLGSLLIYVFDNIENSTAREQISYSQFKEEIIYKIVGNLESDPNMGMISIDTPIARGLVGKFVDDEVSVQTPSGQLNYEILEVKHI